MTLHPSHPPLTLCGLDLEVSNSFKLIGDTIDDKVSFEKHICNIASFLPKKLVLFRNDTKLLAIMMQCPNSSMHLFYLALITVPCLVSEWGLSSKTVRSCMINNYY